MDDVVRIERDAALRLARLLELLVVSCDRIGAYYADAPEADLDHELGRWVRERRLFQELAEARMEVWDALKLGSADEEERFIAQLGPLPYWRRPGD